jgi:uncharacterized OsmC-like protein
MTSQKISEAIRRAQTVFRRRPDLGMHEDTPATARWESGTRVVSSDASGTQVVSDIPSELGGSGDQVTPGWLFRAGLASCAATSIAMKAVTEGIELTTLEVSVTSRSDTRGMLGMVDADGAPIYAGPNDLRLHVRIAAHDVAPECLQALVEASCACSPIPNVVRNAMPLDVRIELGDT